MNWELGWKRTKIVIAGLWVVFSIVVYLSMEFENTYEGDGNLSDALVWLICGLAGVAVLDILERVIRWVVEGYRKKG